jgi:hypothetical protein
MGPADRRRCVEFVDALAEVAWVAGELGHHPGEAAARVQGQLGAGPVQPGVGSVLAQMRTAGFEPGRPYAVMSMTPQSAPDAPGAPATGAAQPPPARPDRAEGAGV